MSWCPQCKTVYVTGTTTCPTCKVALVAALPTEEYTLENTVLVANAPDQQTAEIIVATLEAAGIPAFFLHDDTGAVFMIGPAEGMLPPYGLNWNLDIAVPADREQEALALLQAAGPTEEELIAEEEADPTTLEEAERRVREA